MSDPLLARNAGPVALAAGALFALVDLARWALQRPDDVLGMMTDPLFRVVNGGYFAAFVGLAVGLVALHERLAPHTGRLGLVGFLAALAGTMTQGGNMWFDGFAVPWLADVAPQVFDAEKTITLQVGALAAYLLFALGWMLFGLAVLRARVGARGDTGGAGRGGVLGYQSGLAPYGVPLGLAVAALGARLIRDAHRPALTSSRAEDRCPAWSCSPAATSSCSSSCWPTRSPGGRGSGTGSTRAMSTPRSCPFGPFLAALVMLALIGGRRAIRDWLAKIVHWRVAPAWYAVALLGPPVLTFVAVAINLATGAPADSGRGRCPGSRAGRSSSSSCWS